MNSKGFNKMKNKNDLRLTNKEKIYFLLMFIAYVIVSSLDFNLLYR